MAAAFEFFEKLGVPYFCFHDHDVAPTGSSFAEETANLNELADDMAAHMERTGVGLLWGTARLFGHPRYMAGAATNPNPEVYARAAAQVKNCMDVTHRLGGQNYVLWGGREGYETLLNTDLSRELDQLGRFLNQVVEYKHHIGFRGTILLEPKPQEPTKHQYDYDSQSCFAFLQRYGLEDEVKVNIEVNHAPSPATTSSTSWRWPQRVGFSARSMPTEATTDSAGTPINSRTRWRRCRSASMRSSGPEASRPADSTSIRSCGACRSPVTISSCPHRRHGHARPIPARRSLDA